MRTHAGVVLRDFVKQHGPHKLLPPLSALERIAWPPIEQQAWQEYVIEPMFDSYCGPLSMCTDLRNVLRSMGAPFAAWGSQPLQQVARWDLHSYFEEHRPEILAAAAKD